MKPLALATFWLFALTSLGAAPIGPPPPPGSPRVVLHDLRHANDPKFSEKEQKIISAAYQYVEQQDKAPFDAYYKLTASSKGYTVHIQFVRYSDKTPIYCRVDFVKCF